MVFPCCVQCGTRRSKRKERTRTKTRKTRSNPCRCKVVGPTLGFFAFVATALVEWPVGAVVYPFKHMKGRRIMHHPSRVVYPKVSRAIPI